MLKLSPENRMSFEEFFKHSWVTGSKSIEKIEKPGELDLKEALMSVYDKRKKPMIEEKKELDPKQEEFKENNEKFKEIPDTLLIKGKNNENIVPNPIQTLIKNEIKGPKTIKEPAVNENILTIPIKDPTLENLVIANENSNKIQGNLQIPNKNSNKIQENLQISHENSNKTQEKLIIPDENPNKIQENLPIPDENPQENLLIPHENSNKKEQNPKEIPEKSPKEDLIDIEHISLDDLEKKDVISLYKRLNKDFFDYFLLQMKSLLQRISEIKSAISLFAKEDSPLVQLFAFLLSLVTVKSLKELLCNDITITFEGKVVLKRKLEGLLKGEEGILREIKAGFRELYGDMIVKAEVFQQIQEENVGPLLYKVFLEVVERNIVNEYVLDIRTLRESYRILIEISGFLKHNYQSIAFSISLPPNDVDFDLDKAEEWFMGDLGEEGSVKGVQIKEIADYKLDYEEMEGIFYARMRQFDMDLIQ